LEHEVPQDTVQKPPHQSSFGGSKNPGHHQQPSFTLSDDEDDVYVNFYDNGVSNGEDSLLPKSNVGNAIISVSRDNVQNSNGHYLHDPIHSPYASPFYKENNDTTIQEAVQKDYEEQMQQVIKKWGLWTPLDTSDVSMPNFSEYESRDMPSADFPEISWQRNEDYLDDFLGQGKDLIQRVTQGIYAEYGYDSSTLAGAGLQEMLDKQDEFFSVIVYEYDENIKIVKGQAINEQTGQNMPGIAHMNTHAWEGLVRKLLHAVMTSDDFFVVAVGPASTYRGINFQQSQVMQFNKIMEPVLDKLGIRLLARNMGMDASTTVSALVRLIVCCTALFCCIQSLSCFNHCTTVNLFVSHAALTCEHYRDRGESLFLAKQISCGMFLIRDRRLPRNQLDNLIYCIGRPSCLEKECHVSWNTNIGSFE
jgi:hypothetical protein